MTPFGGHARVSCHHAVRPNLNPCDSYQFAASSTGSGTMNHSMPKSCLSRPKEFFPRSVTGSPIRVVLQIPAAQFGTLVFAASCDAPRSRRSLPNTLASRLLIDAATAVRLCGRSLRSWWSWHAGGCGPSPRFTLLKFDIPAPDCQSLQNAWFVS
jgi:hypothetical protein